MRAECISQGISSHIVLAAVLQLVQSAGAARHVRRLGGVSVPWQGKDTLEHIVALDACSRCHIGRPSRLQCTFCLAWASSSVRIKALQRLRKPRSDLLLLCYLTASSLVNPFRAAPLSFHVSQPHFPWGMPYRFRHRHPTQG